MDSCHFCLSPRIKYHGRVKSSRKRRMICRECRKTFTEDNANPGSPFYKCRVPEQDCLRAVELFRQGLSIRQVASKLGLYPKTAYSILRKSGFIRRCRREGCPNPLSGNRFLFCSDECQAWRKPPKIAIPRRVILSKPEANERLRKILIEHENARYFKGKGKRAKGGHCLTTWLPTPKEIRMQCSKIRAKRDIGDPVKRITPPVLTFPGV